MIKLGAQVRECGGARRVGLVTEVFRDDLQAPILVEWRCSRGLGEWVKAETVEVVDAPATSPPAGARS